MTDSGLTDRQVHLIRQSFAKLRDDHSQEDTTFYDLLFKRHPDFRPMFRDDIQGQGMRFMTTLAMIVETLDAPNLLDPELSRLAKGHGAMGVGAKHYAPLGDALFDTFRDKLGPNFDKETEDAWRTAYAVIAARMIAG